MEEGFLRSARKAKGYTQAQVADKAGVSQGGYTNIENGRRLPSVKMAKRIAAVLDIDWIKMFENNE